MKPICSISSARWSTLISTTELEYAPAPGFHLNVDYQCDGEHYMQHEFHSEERSEYTSLPSDLVDPKTVSFYANHLGFKLTNWDIKNLRLLALATEELCMHLLDGGSVEEWCSAKGLKLIESEWRVPQSKTRPRPLLLQFKKKLFVIPPNRILGTPVK